MRKGACLCELERGAVMIALCHRIERLLMCQGDSWCYSPSACWTDRREIIQVLHLLVPSAANPVPRPLQLGLPITLPNLVIASDTHIRSSLRPLGATVLSFYRLKYACYFTRQLTEALLEESSLRRGTHCDLN